MVPCGNKLSRANIRNNVLNLKVIIGRFVFLFCYSKIIMYRRLVLFTGFSEGGISVVVI